MKKTSIVATACVSAIAIFVAFSATSAHAADLTDERRGAISQNCGSIKSSLKALQKSDSRTRVLLGTTYQNILTNYLTPLNLRLVKSSLPSPELVNLQSDFINSRNDFSRLFISYSQSLEELIATNCQTRPDEFFDRLEITRERRAALSRSVQALADTLSHHLELVEQLEATLEK